MRGGVGTEDLKCIAPMVGLLDGALHLHARSNAQPRPPAHEAAAATCHTADSGGGGVGGGSATCPAESAAATRAPPTADRAAHALLLNALVCPYRGRPPPSYPCHACHTTPALAGAAAGVFTRSIMPLRGWLQH